MLKLTGKVQFRQIMDAISNMRVYTILSVVVLIVNYLSGVNSEMRNDDVRVNEGSKEVQDGENFKANGYLDGWHDMTKGKTDSRRVIINLRNITETDAVIATQVEASNEEGPTKEMNYKTHEIQQIYVNKTNDKNNSYLNKSNTNGELQKVDLIADDEVQNMKDDDVGTSNEIKGRIFGNLLALIFPNLTTTTTTTTTTAATITTSLTSSAGGGSSSGLQFSGVASYYYYYPYYYTYPYYSNYGYYPYYG